MSNFLRDDIFLRSSLRPVAHHSVKVFVSEFGSWQVDRAELNAMGQRKWIALDHDSPLHQAALAGYALGRKTTLNSSHHHFLPEQICQFAANIYANETRLGRQSSAQNVTETYLSRLLAMPLAQAIIALQKHELVADTEHALQSQLLLKDAYQQNNPKLLAIALDCVHSGFKSAHLDDLIDLPLTQPITFTSANTLHLLHSKLQAAAKDDTHAVQRSFLHFPKGTHSGVISHWIDQGLNLPLQPATQDQSLRIVGQLSDGQLTVEQQIQGQWEPLKDQRLTETALSAYQSSLAKASPKLSALQVEALAQNSANISRHLLDNPKTIADLAADLATQQGTELFKVTKTVWVADQPGQARTCQRTSHHALTRAGLASAINNLQVTTESCDGQLRASYADTGISFSAPLLPGHGPDSTAPLAVLTLDGVYAAGQILQISGINELKELAHKAHIDHFQYVFDKQPEQHQNAQDSFVVTLHTSTIKPAEREGETPYLISTQGEKHRLNADEAAAFIRRHHITGEGASTSRSPNGRWFVRYHGETSNLNGTVTTFMLQLESANGYEASPASAKTFAKAAQLPFVNPYEAAPAPKTTAQHQSPRMG